MASKIDLSLLDLNPQEALDVSQAVFEKVLVKPNLTDAHKIVTGIQMKTQIPIFGLLGLSGKKANGCTPNLNGNIVPVTQKYWDPYLSQDRYTHCQADINQLFKLWPRSKEAQGTWEDPNQQMMAFLADRIVDATANQILRVSWFADTTAALDPTGVITKGTDLDYFNQIDGLWKQIFTAVTAEYVQKVNITKNAGASKKAQELGDGDALAILKAMYNKLDARAFDDPNLKYQITRSMFNNLVDKFETISQTFELTRTEDGKNNLSYRCIPIIVRYDWDYTIKKYQDIALTGTPTSPTTQAYLNLPHRAILTPTTNIPLGTSNLNAFESFDAFYDKVTMSHYIDTALYLDAKLIEEDMIVVAY